MMRVSRCLSHSPPGAAWMSDGFRRPYPSRMPTKATGSPPDPDKLVRQQAGTYRTTDDRFEVREADTGWFLVDTTQANEFGQALMLGPFGTLKAVRAAIPDARTTKATTAKPAASPTAKSRSTSKKAKSAPPPSAPPPPPSWIERLSKPEAAEVRKLIGALERQGIPDAEALVRRDREGLFPVVAARLIEDRLEELVKDASPKERARARQLVRRAAELLASGSTGGSGPLPGWALVEIGPEPQPRNRRITIEVDGST